MVILIQYLVRNVTLCTVIGLTLLLGMSPSANSGGALRPLRLESISSYACSDLFTVPDKTSQLEERDFDWRASYDSPGMSWARSASYLACELWSGESSAGVERDGDIVCEGKRGVEGVIGSE